MSKECWSCGHEAEASCAECRRLLAVKSQTMVEIIDDLLGELRALGKREIADAAGRRLNEALSK